MHQRQWGKCLSRKIAVIAGDAYGIGRATADLFTSEGASVFWIDDNAGSESDTHVRVGEVDIPFAHADVANPRAVAAAAARCKLIFDKVDILVNVANVAAKAHFEETTEELWSAMLARNLSSVFLCSRAFLPLMKNSGAGSIINQASIDGFLGNPSIVGYSAAKGGVIPLTHVMAHDLAKYNVRVNCMSTGGIRAAASPGSARDARRIAVTPAGRMGTAEDVAHVALFLASDLSAYVNGANIVVDGGRTGITQGCYDD